MSGIAPVPEDDDAMSGTPRARCVHGKTYSDACYQCEPDCNCAGCVQRDVASAKGFEPEYVYTVWQVHHSGDGPVEIMRSTNRDYLLKNARMLSSQKTDVVVTRQEIILDLRRTGPSASKS